MTDFTPNRSREEEQYELETSNDWLEEAKRRYLKASECYSDPTLHYQAAQAAALIAIGLKGSHL